MIQLKKAKEITGLDIAKITGTEKEYRDLLHEIQERKNLEVLMDDDENNYEYIKPINDEENN